MRDSILVDEALTACWGECGEACAKPGSHLWSEDLSPGLSLFKSPMPSVQRTQSPCLGPFSSRRSIVLGPAQKGKPHRQEPSTPAPSARQLTWGLVFELPASALEGCEFRLGLALTLFAGQSGSRPCQCVLGHVLLGANPVLALGSPRSCPFAPKLLVVAHPLSLGHSKLCLRLVACHPQF